MIERNRHVRAVERLLGSYRAVALLGARQVGKSTLARMIGERYRGRVTRFDLEDPVDVRRLEDPGLALRELTGLVVLDEIHHRPGLFPILRVLADRRRPAPRFLVLGSASPELLKQGSETLAGRIAFHDLGGFALDEVGEDRLARLWLRGGMPRSFLAGSEVKSYEWRLGFIRTFLERDLPGLGSRLPSATMRRFWTMLAHYHGQIWNASEFARSFGIADTTVRRYLDLLSSTFVARQLQPWTANIKKRQVRSPKVYVSDSGLLHALLGLRERRDLEAHPKLGGSWEGFLLEQVVQQLGARPEECYFWATHAGAELDLLVVRGRKRLGFEFKRAEAPAVSRSMRTALNDLELSSLDVVHAGRESFALGRKLRAVAASRILDDIRAL